MTEPTADNLVPPGVLRAVLASLRRVQGAPAGASAALERLGVLAGDCLGPTSGPRHVVDTLVLPLMRVLGLTLARRRDVEGSTYLEMEGEGPAAVPVIVKPWDDELGGAWREAVHAGVATDARWCLVCNGRVLRIVDTHQTWSKRCLEVGLPALGADEDARELLWSLAGESSLTTVPSLLDAVVEAAAVRGVQVNRQVGAGVAEALQALYTTVRPRTSTTTGASSLLEQCLTVVYRVLFLLFAETRGLVPVWDPLYRDQYAIGTMVDRLVEGAVPHDGWQTLQTIARLVHRGCEAGGLSVTAFNGRLFAPSQAADIERRRVPDTVVGRVLLSIGTTRRQSPRPMRTRFDELDVEHLGSVYEHVLEHQPERGTAASLVQTRDARKASGTFYTPRDLAAFLVEQTLAPLVDGRSSDEVLSLRVLDPAMGSGAFLVAACRYIAARAEEALVREGRWHPGDVSEADRASLKRVIVQRCLYGVDVNPVAVQIARLSLWLTATARDRPLSFLDHHLVVGNSLVGASPQDLARPPGGARHRPARNGLPLFDEVRLEDTVAATIRIRRQLAEEPDDTADVVRAKERAYAAMLRPDAPLGAWRHALDFWCASWFWPSATAPDRNTVREVVDHLLNQRSTLPASTLQPLLATSRDCAERWRFLHWTLAFPEVFDDAQCHPGFDAVLGNPPWDMVRGDAGDDDQRRSRRNDARVLTRFVTSSGLYHRCASAHLNQYALFAERVLGLARTGGRVGLVLPSGALSDAGAAPLRMRLFNEAGVDRVVGFDNRSAIFPIHRSVRFSLLMATTGQETREIRCRFGLTDTRSLEHVWSPERTIHVSRALLERTSGIDDMALPDLEDPEDLRILESVTASVPRLGSADGWGVRFGRELNASDDRTMMAPWVPGTPGRRVVEGKMMRPFQVHLERCRMVLTPAGASRCRVPMRPRLGYREVAGAGNRTTLIAAIVPPSAVTTHSVFCLKADMPLDRQQVLCALLNSYVANFLVRLRVGTHVTAALMAGVRVPVVPSPSPVFARLLRLFLALADADDVETHPAHAALQAAAAHVYGLDSRGFARVLATFPLVPASVRDACFHRFVTEPIDGWPVPRRDGPGRP